MQPSEGQGFPALPALPAAPAAVPGQPHTRTRPVHWLATGAALAAAVATAALIQPPGASATADPSATAADAPDPSAAHFPLDCAGQPVAVLARGSADLDGDGRPETAVVVRCQSPMGTPPSGLFVLSQGARPTAPPRITGELVDPRNKLSVTDLAVHGRTVSATLWGYSSDDVPRCCPDLRRGFSWTWRDGRFTAVPGPHLGSV